MMRLMTRLARGRPHSSSKRSRRPALEGLEDRLLLYSATGGSWTYGSRITYSFVPDGTNVGGTSSSLFSTLNAKFETATWQQQFQRAAAVWAAAANINLVQVSDSGAAVGSSGNQQGDSRFGDIRIGMTPQSGSVLGLAFLPPPFNGGTNAGDILLNSNTAWQINSDYDLQTVAIHEFGHALGLGHSAISTADMYASYNAIKQSLTSDDTAGLQSVYSTRQADALEGASGNNSSAYAANITSYLDDSNQIAIPGLDITTTSDADWFKVTVPSNTSGTLSVSVQSTNLSSLSPRVQLYNSSLVSLGFQSKANTYGETVTVTATGVSPGQVYYIKASNANTGPTGVGAYGLLVNLGGSQQSPIAPPNTTVAARSDQGGGSSNISSPDDSGLVPIGIDEPGPGAIGRGVALLRTISVARVEAPGLISYGTLVGWGDHLSVDGHDHEHGHDEGPRRNEGGTADPPRDAPFLIGISADQLVDTFGPRDLLELAKRKRK